MEFVCDVATCPQYSNGLPSLYMIQQSVCMYDIVTIYTWCAWYGNGLPSLYTYSNVHMT